MLFTATSLKDEIKRRDQPRAHSASQTDPVEEAEFDWNLSDRNDSETQVLIVIRKIFWF